MTGRPVDTNTGGQLVQPAELDATLEGTVSAVVRTAQDVLWAMEDMLLRIAGHCPITINSQGDQLSAALRAA